MNLVSLEYFLTNKTQNMDMNALLYYKIETLFFDMTRYSLLYNERNTVRIEKRIYVKKYFVTFKFHRDSSEYWRKDEKAMIVFIWMVTLTQPFCLCSIIHCCIVNSPLVLLH